MPGTSSTLHTPADAHCLSMNPQHYRPTRRAVLIGGSAMPILSVSGSSAARAAASPQLKNSALDRLFAEAMHSGMKDYEKRLQPIKTELFAAARGYLDTLTSPQVLEIGIGTGPNLRYLRSPGANSDVHILGLEPNQYMISYLKEEAARVGLDVTVIPGVAESMTTIPSASIDLVVCTLVLCSVTDVSRALEEMARVLKPAGRLLIIEHVRGSGLTQLGQTVFSPLQQFLADGCHLDRDFTEDPAAGRLFEVSGIKATDVGGLGLLARHNFLTIPAEVTRQLAVCEGELATCEKSVDMQRIASTSGAEGGRDDAHLDTAQLYIDVSRYVQALVRIVCLCEGRTEAEPPPANIGSLQDKLDKARARYERHTKAKKRQLTLGIEDANKVIAAVSKSKRNGASKPVKVDGKKRKKVNGRGSMEKHRTMGFLDELKKPT